MFGGRSYSDSERIRTKSSHHRTASPSRSSTSGYYVRPGAGASSSSRSQPSSSFFGGGASSSRGIFSSGGNNGGSSYYRRRPRNNYMTMLWQKLQRMVRDLWSYARRHPVKAFFAVVVPLLSAGGAVHGLLSQFGVRVPGLSALAGGMGGGSGRGGGGGYYGSHGYGGSGGGGNDWMSGAGSLMQIAKAFM